MLDVKCSLLAKQVLILVVPLAIFLSVNYNEPNLFVDQRLLNAQLEGESISAVEKRVRLQEPVSWRFVFSILGITVSYVFTCLFLVGKGRQMQEIEKIRKRV